MCEAILCLVNAAAVSFAKNPVEFIMGPALLPVAVSVSFTMLAIAWKAACFIEMKIQAKLK